MHRLYKVTALWDSLQEGAPIAPAEIYVHEGGSATAVYHGDAGLPDDQYSSLEELCSHYGWTPEEVLAQLGYRQQWCGDVLYYDSLGRPQRRLCGQCCHPDASDEVHLGCGGILESHPL